MSMNGKRLEWVKRRYY